MLLLFTAQNTDRLFLQCSEPDTVLNSSCLNVYLVVAVTSVERSQVLSFTHPVSFHSAETFESLLSCLKMEDEKVAEAALQIFKNTGSKLEESFPHIKL